MLSPLHRLWRLLPPDRRRALFARATAAMAPRPDRLPPPARAGLVIGGELSRASGLGEAARLMRAGCDALGVAHWDLDISHRLPGGGEAPAFTMPPAGAPLLLQVNAPMLPWVLLSMKRSLLRGRRVVGCWAWELPSVPASWQVGRRFVHEVWVLSHFTADALAGLGLTVPLRVVHLPVALAPPRPSALSRADFGWPDDAVVVLVSFNLASSFARKNPLGAIAAFRQAFGDRTDRFLVLKLSHAENFPEDLAALRRAAAFGNVRVDARTLPIADSHAMMACADIVLSLHRSEGFGLVPAEAMLLGRPVVATAWSGNMDFMDEDSAALVNFRLIPAVDPRGVFQAPGAVWADPDIAHAAHWLARLADDPDGRAALGRRGQAMARARLGVDSMRTAVAGLGLPVAG